MYEMGCSSNIYMNLNIGNTSFKNDKLSQQYCPGLHKRFSSGITSNATGDPHVLLTAFFVQ